MSLVSSAPKVIELEEEPYEEVNPIPPTIVKETRLVKHIGKGKKMVFSQVSTRSYTKASIQRIATLATALSEVQPCFCPKVQRCHKSNGNFFCLCSQPCSCVYP